MCIDNIQGMGQTRRDGMMKDQAPQPQHERTKNCLRGRSTLKKTCQPESYLTC